MTSKPASNKGIQQHLRQFSRDNSRSVPPPSKGAAQCENVQRNFVSQHDKKPSSGNIVYGSLISVSNINPYSAESPHGGEGVTCLDIIETNNQTCEHDKGRSLQYLEQQEPGETSCLQSSDEKTIQVLRANDRL